MVKVVEIEDEKDEQNSVYATTEGSASTDSLDSVLSEPEHESFFERIAALKDIVPPTTRYAISSRVSKTFSVVKQTGKLAGNVVWVVTTSALLVGLPLALILEDEAKIVAQEKEMLAQQAGAQQMMGGYPGTNPNEQQKGVVPPGF
ncbi:TOM22 [Sanghuangporus vaninii]